MSMELQPLRIQRRATDTTNRDSTSEPTATSEDEQIRQLHDGRLNPRQITNFDDGETIFMNACRSGHLRLVLEILKADPEIVREVNLERKTALAIAADAGHKETVLALIDCILTSKQGNSKDVIDQADMGGFSALMWASYRGCVGIAEVLVNQGKANTNFRSHNNMTCLMWAAGRGHVAVSTILLDNGAQPNATDKFGGTALLWACRAGNLEIVELLLQRGANPDISGQNLRTPLMIAAKAGRTDIIRSILESRVLAQPANPNLLDKDGNSALASAAIGGHADVVSELLKSKVFVNLPNKKNDTALILAARASKVEVVRKLCEFGAELNHRGGDGRTALYAAVDKQAIDVIEALLQRRGPAAADTEIQAEDGNTALLRATKLKCAGAVDMLLNAGAKLTATDQNGDTCLHIALRLRVKKIVHLLLRNPRNARLLYKPNKQNVTPYSIDESSEQPVLPQIFGTMNLNRSEHNQSLVGYELYSSSLAVTLSEPSLATPLTVGLYARWGSGKNFVIGQLRDYLLQYSKLEDGAGPRLNPSVLAFMGCFGIGALVCLIVLLASSLWYAGIAAGAITFMVLSVTFVLLWWCSRNWPSPSLLYITSALAMFLQKLDLLASVLFRNPSAAPSSLPQHLRFIFVDCPKAEGGRLGSIVRLVLSEMYRKVELEYGGLLSKLLFIANGANQKASSRSHIYLCCIPLYAWCFIVLASLYADIILIWHTWPPFQQWSNVTSKAAEGVKVAYDTESVFIVILSAVVFVGLIAAIAIVLGPLAAMALYPPHRRLLGDQNAVLSDEALSRMVKQHTALLSRSLQAIDTFSLTQTRIVLILDELDDYDQANAVHTLDMVHRYFGTTEVMAPFICLLVLDPHIIIKYLENHLAESAYEGVQMTGYDYLRSVVHLPIFLQAQPSLTIPTTPTPSIAPSVSVTGSVATPQSQQPHGKPRFTVTQVSTQSPAKPATRPSQLPGPVTAAIARTSTEQSQFAFGSAVSISSQGGGAATATELSEMLTNMSAEYFSDVNPRTLARVSNITTYIGRLLHASSVHYQWLHLTAWVNLIEQWPYLVSCLLVFVEQNASHANYDMRTPLRSIYPSVKRCFGALLARDSLRFIDKNLQKLEAALQSTQPTLTLQDVSLFLRFSVNLDPYLRRRVREQSQELQLFKPHRATPSTTSLPSPVTVLSPKATKPLKKMNVEDVCELLTAIQFFSQEKMVVYKELLTRQNICGPVLAICDLEDLYHSLSPAFSFGDWQLFKAVIISLRESSKVQPKPPSKVDVRWDKLLSQTAKVRRAPSRRPKELDDDVESQNRLILDLISEQNQSVDDDEEDAANDAIAANSNENVVDGVDPSIQRPPSLSSAIHDVEANLLMRAVTSWTGVDESSRGDDDEDEDATDGVENGEDNGVEPVLHERSPSKPPEHRITDAFRRSRVDPDYNSIQAVGDDQQRVVRFAHLP